MCASCRLDTWPPIKKECLLSGIAQSSSHPPTPLPPPNSGNFGGMVISKALTLTGWQPGQVLPEFVVACKFRLGLPVYDQAGPCPSCGIDSDILGDHSMVCGTAVNAL